MSLDSLIPAAQYLRMSTEHQRYSLENQALIIARYADRHRFSVVRTYSDAARTGVIFRCREGLKKLIQDVVQGAAAYKVILVYDVSRWGRFQDCDEAAYYEFLCKSAGIPVHYCSETFSNDNAMPNVIMKSLKRVMAGEYSRELGAKVYTGQKTLANLGFRQGGFAGYGLRRMLLSALGTPKQLLEYGERKCIADDRVILVPGPANEVRCVRKIYDMFIRNRMSFRGIAQALNRRQVRYLGSSRWNERAISAILTRPKYAGFNVYGQHTQKLYTQKIKMPRSEWIVIPGAFEALVTPEEFTAAQQIIKRFTHNQTNEELLEHLRSILLKFRKITTPLILKTPGAPSPNTYRMRFGSLMRAYQRIGYRVFRHGDWLEKNRNVQALRTKLMKEIVDRSKGCVSIDTRQTRHTRLRFQNGRFVTVLACRHFAGHRRQSRWLLKPVPAECNHITLAALLNPDKSTFKNIFVVRPIGDAVGVYVLENSARLRQGVKLHDLADFVRAVEKVALKMKKSRCDAWL